MMAELFMAVGRMPVIDLGLLVWGIIPLSMIKEVLRRLCLQFYPM